MDSLVGAYGSNQQKNYHALSSELLPDDASAAAIIPPRILKKGSDKYGRNQVSGVMSSALLNSQEYIPEGNMVRRKTAHGGHRQIFDSGQSVLTKKASMPAGSGNFHTQKHTRKSKMADNISSYNLNGSP